ncbi:hypothetical protein F5883DRAFT_138206 [Diaporthe sp. PMI_573]|nr:hypothetical protein F5883DRAFT_138206 [Diaporthaceae sp. PMI_573]
MDPHLRLILSLTTLLQPQPGAVTGNRRGSRHVSCGFIFCIHTSSECASIDEGSWNHGMAASKVFWNFARPTKKERQGSGSAPCW